MHKINPSPGEKMPSDIETGSIEPPSDQPKEVDFRLKPSALCISWGAIEMARPADALVDSDDNRNQLLLLDHDFDLGSR